MEVVALWRVRASPKSGRPKIGGNSLVTLNVFLWKKEFGCHMPLATLEMDILDASIERASLEQVQLPDKTVHFCSCPQEYGQDNFHTTFDKSAFPPLKPLASSSTMRTFSIEI